MLRYIILLIVLVVVAVEGPALLPSIMSENSQQAASVREEPHQTAVSSASRSVMLEAGNGGHFRTDVRINNRWINVMVDTGATAVAIPYEEAGRLGIRPGNADFTVATHTANGIKYSAPVRLEEVRIGDIMLHDVEALVSPRGSLSVTLLGMSFLGRLSQVEMREGRLVMVQ